MRTKLTALLCALTMTAGALLSGCGGQEEASTRLLIAHTHSTNHPVHTGLSAFTQELEANTDLNFTIYANGTLGGNSDLIQMVRAGVLDIAKVSAPSLEQFNPAYAIFSLPYVFVSQEHYFNVMHHSAMVKEIYDATRAQGFIAIGWFDSGSRSIYTTKEPVRTPSDLHGLKIRTQDSPTSIEMISYMGGSATPMSSGEVYSSLQQGIIDGAENNETVLSDDGHGQVAKHYSYTEHQYTPDIVIMSTKTFDRLSPEDQAAILQAMDTAWAAHEEQWQQIVARNITEAKEIGVNFYRIDKTPFIEACAPMHEEFKTKAPRNAAYLEDFLSFIPQNEGGNTP